MVQGLCGNVPCFLFADSGSSVSLVSSSFVKRIGWENRIQKYDIKLTSITQNRIKTDGIITLPVSIAGRGTQHSFVVTELLDTQFLMGLDFMQDKGVTMDHQLRVLRLPDGSSAPLIEKPQNVKKSSKIRCARTTVIEPHTVQYISGKIHSTSRNVQGLTQPYYNTERHTGLVLNSAVVHTEGRFLPAQCANPTDEPVVLHKNKLLGFLQPLGSHKSVHAVHRIELSQENGSSNFPHHENFSTLSPPTCIERWTKEELFARLRLDKLPSKVTAQEMGRLEDILWKYRTCFSYDDEDIGSANMYTAEIKLKPDAVPVWTPAREAPYKLRDEMDKQINSMLRSGIIEPCKVHSDWNTPLFLVKKSAPNSWRLVADLRGVNKMCMDDKFQLPNLNYLLDKVGDDTLFTVSDLSAAFSQVPYSEQSKPITAFTYRGSRYNYARMIMGHKNSSSGFTRMMTQLLINYPKICFFMDDVMVTSRDVSTHLDRFETLLQQLLSANLKLSPKKTYLLRNEVRYVGVTINAEGIRINEDRVQALQELRPPQTVKETQQLMGFLNYNRRFIKNFSDIARPIYQVMKKGQRFNWSEECQFSLDELKARIADNTVLCIPDVDDHQQSYQLEIDASNRGYGSTLTQVIGGERRTVAYFSKAVPPYKRELGQTRLEFEALYESLKFFSVYLRNTRFKVVTDCLALLSLENNLFAKTNPTLVRRIQELANYRFDIVHTSGKTNNIADFLSRYQFQVRTRNVGTQVDDPEVTECDDHAFKVIPAPKMDQVDPVDQPVPEPPQEVAAQIRVHEDYADQAPDSEELGNLFSQDNAPGSVTVVDVSTDNREDDPWCVCALPEMLHLERRDDSEDLLLQEHEIWALSRPELQELPDMERLKKEQILDPVLNIVRGWVEAGNRAPIQANRAPETLMSLYKQFNLLKMESGLLKRRWVCKKEEDSKDLIVVPETCTEEVMNLFHDNISHCHPGAAISTERCRQHFYWPRMADEFLLYVKACTRCNESKQPRAYLKGPLKHLFFHHFNDAICVDHIVPDSKNKTPRGFRYILTITDCWSNYLVAVPVRTQTAKESISAIMKNWVYRFGVCREIIVDNHPNFTSQFFTQVWAAFDCKKTHGTSYKSASTARAENNNKRVNQALRACLPAGKEHDWDIYLTRVTFALNSLKNRRTGYSSNKMVFCRELNVPLTILTMGDREFKPTPVDSTGREVYQLHKEMTKIIRKVQRNATVDFMYAKRYHDKNINGEFFKPGDYCYVLIQCRDRTHCSKYSPKWRGPVRINRVINEHLYTVQLTPEIEKVVNICKMKQYELNKFSKKRIQALEKSRKQAATPRVQQNPVPRSGHDVLSEDSEDDFVILSDEKPCQEPSRNVQGQNVPSTPQSPQNQPVATETMMQPTDADTFYDASEEQPHHETGPVVSSSPAATPPIAVKRREGLRNRALLKRPDRF